MDFAYLAQLGKRKKGDACILPFWQEKGKVEAAYPLSDKLQLLIDPVLETKDFQGKEGDVLCLYVEGEPERRLLLVGLGVKGKITRESLRRSYGNAAKSCLSKKWKILNLAIPQKTPLKEEDLLKGIAEGLLLPNYSFNRLKQLEEGEEEALIQKITWIGPQREVLKKVSPVLIICEGVNEARDLVNDNADHVTPQYLAQWAIDLGKNFPAITTTVFDKKRIEKENLALLLAVNRGSALDPAFIIMSYQGAPRSRDHTILLGKGVTYDTGGLNLKPTGGMETMKCDMAGAAACLAVMKVVCQLGLKVNLSVVVPSTENGIDAKSFKPGDVYSSYAGKKVEMTNSDAEGRLILADALAYAVKNLQPTRLIDIATLTGAIEIALGPEASGLMSTDEQLAQGLIEAGEITYERLWRMPLYEEYKEKLKSDIADLKSWNGRSASSNVAATFLRQFVGESIPWAHLDIAGTAYLPEGKRYLPKYATGVGVRLLVEFLSRAT